MANVACLFMTIAVGAIGLPASVVLAQDPQAAAVADSVQQPFEMPDTSQFILRFENGMTGFVVADSISKRLRLTAFIRAGTADDLVPGAAEALAHLMGTRGPCWMAPGRFAQAMEQMEAVFHVSMGEEMTEVTFSVPIENAARGVRIFSGIVREPCVDEEGLAAFRAAVAEDILPPVGRMPTDQLYEGSAGTAAALFHLLLFRNHRYGRQVTAEEARELTVEDVEAFANLYFIPINVVLAASGAIAPMELARTVDQRFADWERRRAPILQRFPDIASTGPREIIRYRGDSPKEAWVVMGNELEPIPPRDRPALHVMSYILGGGDTGSRLVQAAWGRQELSNDVVAVARPNLRGPGSFTFRASTRPASVNELVDLMFGEIERIGNEPVTEFELNAAKSALADRVVPQMLTSAHRAARTMAEEYARYGTLVHLVRYPQQVREVSVRDVLRAAQLYLLPDRMIVVILAPAESQS